MQRIDQENEVLDTLRMIRQENLDIRTITMGISLLDCACQQAWKKPRRISYDKIARRAENLVKTGETIEEELGIPIVNKRICVTPMSLVARDAGADRGLCGLCQWPMDEAAAEPCGVNLIGGFSGAGAQGLDHWRPAA